jgi:hypothetical protein
MVHAWDPFDLQVGQPELRHFKLTGNARCSLVQALVANQRNGDVPLMWAIYGVDTARDLRKADSAVATDRFGTFARAVHFGTKELTDA